jgi:hypothetical protein
MTNKDKSKGYDEGAGRKRASGDRPQSSNLRDSRMMAHLMDAMQEGQDIGHFGRLTFVMVARHFLPEEELVLMLSAQPGMDEKEARVMVLQVRERGYNPPKRERILRWMAQQEFPICPDAQDPEGCNVYRELQFPEEIYDRIEEYWEERVEAEDEG